MTQWILHVDMDAFFAAIEQRNHPEYKNKPLIVGADPKKGKGRGAMWSRIVSCSNLSGAGTVAKLRGGTSICCGTDLLCQGSCVPSAIALSGDGSRYRRSTPVS